MVIQVHVMWVCLGTHQLVHSRTCELFQKNWEHISWRVQECTSSCVPEHTNFFGSWCHLDLQFLPLVFSLSLLSISSLYLNE